MKRSIRRQLLLWLIIPLVSLSLVSTIASYYLGIGLAREVYDRQLVNSADSVVARIRTKDGTITTDLPQAAKFILQHNGRDQFYYQVISPEGKLLSGDKLLPSPPAINPGDAPIFRTMTLKGMQVRIVTMVVASEGSHLVVQAAETRNLRSDLAGQITMSILVAQLLLIASGAVAIWIGIGRGLAPLAEIERAVESRSPGDFGPLDVQEPLEVSSLVKALNQLFIHLGEDIELQKRFISNAAHQLRTPLAVLGTYCDLARKLVVSKQSNEAQEVLSELDSGITRMSKLVNRLLALARSEPSVATNRNHCAVDLNSIASTATAANVPESIRKRIELEFFPAAEQALVQGDQSSLEELVSNLVENSITYTPAGGNIAVKVFAEQDRVYLRIEDDGPGIPVAERQKVFERFYRIPGTEQPGTGLGLAIVKEIAIVHNATIRILDRINGKGTSMTVTFPKATRQTTADTIATALSRSRV